MFAEHTTNTIAAAARRKAIYPSALLALVEIESGGRVSVKIAGKEKALIRFEGHYFDRRLSGGQREAARAQGLASPRAGGIGNPADQAKRRAMLERACAIDRKAALESVSWGIGQVMGAHWAWLGYASVDELAAAADAGLEGQLDLMLRFVEKSGIMPHLKARAWPRVARIYNGPGYRKHRYDTRLADAQARWSKHLAGRSMPESSSTPDPVSSGTVRAVQEALRRQGHDIAADGIMGPRTVAALRSWQKVNGLPDTGMLDEATMSALPGAHAGSQSGPRGWLRRAIAAARWLVGLRTAQP